MDALDEALIAALRRDGRASLSDLAARLGASRATLRARIERLREAGVIAGFTVVLSGEARPAPVRGIVLVAIEGKAAAGAIRRLRGFAEVAAIHTTVGRWDLVLELGVETLGALDDALRRIRLIDSITASETSLLLATPHGPEATRSG